MWRLRKSKLISLPFMETYMFSTSYVDVNLQRMVQNRIAKQIRHNFFINNFAKLKTSLKTLNEYKTCASIYQVASYHPTLASLAFAGNPDTRRQ